MHDELKPCPICGGEAEYVSVDVVGHPWHGWKLRSNGVAVACVRCGCTQPSRLDTKMAAEMWNERSGGGRA